MSVEFSLRVAYILIKIEAAKPTTLYSKIELKKALQKSNPLDSKVESASLTVSCGDCATYSIKPWNNFAILFATSVSIKSVQ